jgi:hypothetical protein
METNKVRVSLLGVLSYWNVFWNQEKLLDNLDQEEKDKEILRFFSWIIGSTADDQPNPPTSHTPRKKAKTQSPKSHPKTAIGADFLKKVSGVFFSPPS